jgi:hypothetical protein
MPNSETQASPPEYGGATGSAAFLKLVDDYGNACARAGASNSGCCIDPSGPSRWSYMQELRAKLRGLAPHFDTQNNAMTQLEH